MKEELRWIYPQLPETFGRRGANALLEYEPERAGLDRILAELDQKGTLVIAKIALGRTPAAYRKIAAELPPDDGPLWGEPPPLPPRRRVLSRTYSYTRAGHNALPARCLPLPPSRMPLPSVPTHWSPLPAHSTDCTA
jgi:hypothetical protein